MSTDQLASVYDSIQLGPITLQNRLIVGTGKYENYEIMQEALDVSGAEVITVAVRRERLIDAEGRSMLDFIDTDRYTILPNTAGCFSAEDAIRVSRLGREILEQMNNPGQSWVKLEVLGDKKTLLPDPVGTLEACRELVADGFTVMCYTSDDPIMAARLRDAGATSVMPAGSPIGSGRGIANPSAIAIILQLLKDPEHGGDPNYPVIVDAGVGTPSDVTLAMELGADGVLLNTGIAHAKQPVRMARAMRAACEAGYLGFRAGRIPKRMYATASSPWEGTISYIPGE
ncbi:MAG: thiazole synthase [Phycisphaerales bacterium]|nr:MAG: thiazole synthase [Phycisphaerales bacterium]